MIIKDGEVFATQRGYGKWQGRWDCPDFHLTMHCYLCTLDSSAIRLNEHEAAWLTRDTIDSVKWLPADEGLVNKIKGIIGPVMIH